MTDFFTPNVLIGLAAGCFALGYLIIHQMRLRIMMFIGSGFYIAYYATAAADPLYGAMFTTSGMMVANLIGMTILMLRRYRISLPAAHVDIYPKFDMLIPGDFRLVMKFAERLTLAQDTVITTEGGVATHLYFVLTGEVHVRKLGAEFCLPDGVFVGEVAYLLNCPSTATTTIQAGSEILRWDLATLRKSAIRNPRFKLAIDAMLGHDLARKVGEAVAPPIEFVSSQRD